MWIHFRNGSDRSLVWSDRIFVWIMCSFLRVPPVLINLALLCRVALAAAVAVTVASIACYLKPITFYKVIRCFEWYTCLFVFFSRRLIYLRNCSRNINRIFKSRESAQFWNFAEFITSRLQTLTLLPGSLDTVNRYCLRSVYGHHSCAVCQSTISFTSNKLLFLTK